MANGTTEDTGPQVTQIEGYREVYLYYLKPTANYHRHVDVYLIDQHQPKVLDEQAIRDLVKLADDGDITPICYKIEHLPWHYKSYVVFVLRDTTKNLSVVDFKHVGTGGNHSFQKVNSFQKTATDDLSGIWFINLRLNKNHQPLGDETEKFKVKFPQLKTVQVSGFIEFLIGLKVLTFILKLLHVLEPKSHNETGSNIGP